MQFIAKIGQNIQRLDFSGLCYNKYQVHIRWYYASSEVIFFSNWNLPSKVSRAVNTSIPSWFKLIIYIPHLTSLTHIIWEALTWVINSCNILVTFSEFSRCLVLSWALWVSMQCSKNWFVAGNYLLELETVCLMENMTQTISQLYLLMILKGYPLLGSNFLGLCSAQAELFR